MIRAGSRKQREILAEHVSVILKVRPHIHYWTPWMVTLERYCQMNGHEILSDPAPRGPMVRGLQGR